jgi:hypothetical protein
MRKKTALVMSLLCCFALAAAGCDGGEEEQPPPEEGTPDAEACEHLAEGPSAAVTASDTAAATAPAISNDHKRYDIALVDDMNGEKVGVVTFAPDEAADFLFFLSADVPLAIEDGSGAAVAIEDKQTSIPECTDVKARHQVELDVGTYYLRVGPTAEASVNVVVEEAGGHQH